MKLRCIVLALALAGVSSFSPLPALPKGGALRPSPGHGRTGPGPVGQPTKGPARIPVPPLAGLVDPNLYIPEGVELRSWLGFLGGTVGVLGTLLTYEKARFRMKQRILCPYCNGGGVITCGACLGCGKTLVKVGPNGAKESCACETCGGIGEVACVNCKAEGVTVPVALQRKEFNMNTDELELALEEMGIAALAANYNVAKARERLNVELEAAADIVAEKKKNVGASGES
eukprot:CAMPEP_0172614274 /NCGR_PEP_ID=MMETSP1068-20121228/49311_1 /TAXON_ID=35684 /ORGANISM="Pseudopedinella elastica, Strain CCMP716" /LENGTH=229 /DNA_ID=CAMNT_0013419011 /DNA_START=126 /DNA_END=815 /DNA_ORIENTATION=-